MNPPKKPPTNPESGRIFAETCRPRAAKSAKSLPISFVYDMMFRKILRGMP